MYIVQCKVYRLCKHHAPIAGSAAHALLHPVCARGQGNPQRFTELVLGTCWINDPLVKSFCIEFLSDLKSARATKLLNNQGP